MIEFANGSKATLRVSQASEEFQSWKYKQNHCSSLPKQIKHVYSNQVASVLFFLFIALFAIAATAATTATVAATNSTGQIVLTNGFGDLNLDRKIDVLDPVRLQNHLNGTRVLTVNLAKKADLNQDGLVDGKDLQILSDIILQRRLGSEDDFDADGLANAREMQWQTNPFNRDTDKDAWWDGWEVEDGSDPLDSSSWLRMMTVARPPIQVKIKEPEPVLAAGVTVAHPPIKVVLPLTLPPEEQGRVILARPPVTIVNTNQ